HDDADVAAADLAEAGQLAIPRSTWDVGLEYAGGAEKSDLQKASVIVDQVRQPLLCAQLSAFASLRELLLTAHFSRGVSPPVELGKHLLVRHRDLLMSAADCSTCGCEKPRAAGRKYLRPVTQLTLTRGRFMVALLLRTAVIGNDVAIYKMTVHYAK